MLMELAGEAPREIISVLLASTCVRKLPGVIEAFRRIRVCCLRNCRRSMVNRRCNVARESAEAGRRC